MAAQSNVSRPASALTPADAASDSANVTEELNRFARETEYERLGRDQPSVTINHVKQNIQLTSKINKIKDI